jgi:hypothetical protein
MAITVTCPEGHEWTAEEWTYAGGSAVCPVCAVTVRVPGAAFGLERPSARPEDRPKAAPAADANAQPHRLPDRRFARLHLGLGFQYARVLLDLVNILAVMVGFLLTGGLLMALASGTASATIVEVIGGVVSRAQPLLNRIGTVLCLAQLLLKLIGSVLCLWAPKESNARGFILAALALDVAAIPLGIFPGLNVGATIVAALLGLASWVLFMVFLSNLAFYFHRPDDGNEAFAIIAKGILVVVGISLVYFGLVLLLMFGTSRVPQVVFEVLLFLALLALPFLLLYFVTKLLFRVLKILGNLRQKTGPGVEAAAPQNLPV